MLLLTAAQLAVGLAEKPHRVSLSGNRSESRAEVRAHQSEDETVPFVSLIYDVPATRGKQFSLTSEPCPNA